MQNHVKIWSGTRALSEHFKLVHCVLPAVAYSIVTFIAPSYQQPLSIHCVAKLYTPLNELAYDQHM